MATASEIWTIGLVEGKSNDRSEMEERIVNRVCMHAGELPSATRKQKRSIVRLRVFLYYLTRPALPAVDSRLSADRQQIFPVSHETFASSLARNGDTRGTGRKGVTEGGYVFGFIYTRRDSRAARLEVENVAPPCPCPPFLRFTCNPFTAYSLHPAPVSPRFPSTGFARCTGTLVQT